MIPCPGIQGTFCLDEELCEGGKKCVALQKKQCRYDDGSCMWPDCDCALRSVTLSVGRTPVPLECPRLVR